MVACAQPREVAAKSAATRVAEEMDVQVFPRNGCAGISCTFPAHGISCTCAGISCTEEMDVQVFSLILEMLNKRPHCSSGPVFCEIQGPPMAVPGFCEIRG